MQTVKVPDSLRVMRFQSCELPCKHAIILSVNRHTYIRTLNNKSALFHVVVSMFVGVCECFQVLVCVHFQSTVHHGLFHP